MLDYVLALAYLEVLGAIGTGISVYLLSIQRLRLGFQVGVFGNFFWLLFSLQASTYWLMGLNVLLMIFNYNGIRNLNGEIRRGLTEPGTN